jgi:DNA-binding NarL/FixJ family response regulator
LLNDDEKRTLLLLADGRSEAEICEWLHIAPKTLRDRLVKIARKLGIRNRGRCRGAALVAWTWKHLMGGTK